MMEGLEGQVLALLAEVCGEPRVAGELELDLYGENLMDSFALVHLLEGLEQRFGVEIWPTQVGREEFATPRKIVELVQRAADPTRRLAP